MIKKILLVFFLYAAQEAGAQVPTTVKAIADKNKILIGEPIQLTLEADIPETEPILFFSIDSIPHFEFLDKGKVDTSNTINGTVIRQIILITSWDSGHWVIPSFVLSGKLSTDSIPIDVGFTPSFDPSQPYHDIKDIIEVEPEKKQEWWYYAVGGGLLLLLLLYLLLRKKKKPAQTSVAHTIDPFEEAMKALDAIKSEKLDPKTYYSKLIDIFRLYVFRRKEILSLQKTTDDLVLQLSSLPLSKELSDSLAQALRLSDFVKFAKYTPSAGDDRSVFETIKKGIQEIEGLK